MFRLADIWFTVSVPALHILTWHSKLLLVPLQILFTALLSAVYVTSRTKNKLVLVFVQLLFQSTQSGSLKEKKVEKGAK